MKFGEMDEVGELDRWLNFEGMVGCLSTRIERRKPRLPAGGSCPKYRHEGGWLTETSISRNLPKTWGAGGACKGRKGAKDNREVGRQCSRQFPHVAFSKTYFSSSSASDLRSSSSGLRMASFREQPRLLTVFHARIFLPSFCLPASFFLFWNYRPLTPTLSSSGDKINLTESSYADESVNLQGLPKVQKFDEFFGKKLVKTFKTLLVLDTRAVNKINPLD